jgi:hypothetical protein
MSVPIIPRARVLEYLIFNFLVILTCGNIACAQLGEGPWEEVLPIGKVDKSLRAYIQFEDKDKNFWESPWKVAGSVQHFVEGYSYDPATKTETFITFESPDNHRRVEFRGPDYETGTYQFEGELLIEDDVTDDVWVMQLWHAALIKYRNDHGAGKLTYHSANDATGEARVGVVEIASSVRGKSVKLNVIHTGAPSFDLELTVSVDGEPQNDGQPFKFKTFDAAGNFYVKYGAYCGPGKQQTVKWINTRVWRKASSASVQAVEP